MRKTLMCPKCGYVDCPQEDNHKYDICPYCNTKKIQIDFSGDEVYSTPTTEFDALEQKLNRKFLYQLPTFDEAAYEARIKKDEQANASIKKMFDELDNLPRCPYCNSVNLSKITAGGRLLSVGFLGFASGKMGKQWHCKNCGSDF